MENAKFFWKWTNVDEYDGRYDLTKRFRVPTILVGDRFNIVNLAETLIQQFENDFY